jgi:hypothetical protein
VCALLPTAPGPLRGPHALLCSPITCAPVRLFTAKGTAGTGVLLLCTRALAAEEPAEKEEEEAGAEEEEHEEEGEGEEAHEAVVEEGGGHTAAVLVLWLAVLCVRWRLAESGARNCGEPGPFAVRGICTEGLSSPSCRCSSSPGSPGWFRVSVSGIHARWSNCHFPVALLASDPAVTLVAGIGGAA